MQPHAHVNLSFIANVLREPMPSSPLATTISQECRSFSRIQT